MAVRERRRGNQSNPQDKANFLIIGGFFVTLWIILFKSWQDAHFAVVTGFAGTIIGALGVFLTGRAHPGAQQSSDAGVNAGTVEHMTVRPDAVQSDYVDDRKTKELSPELLRDIQTRR